MIFFEKSHNFVWFVWSDQLATSVIWSLHPNLEASKNSKWSNAVLRRNCGTMRSIGNVAMKHKSGLERSRAVPKTIWGHQKRLRLFSLHENRSKESGMT